MLLVVEAEARSPIGESISVTYIEPSDSIRCLVLCNSEAAAAIVQEPAGAVIGAVAGAGGGVGTAAAQEPSANVFENDFKRQL